MNDLGLKNSFTLHLCIFLASFIASLLILSAITGTPIILFLTDLWQTQILPNKNTLELQTKSGLNPSLIAYIGIVLSFLLLSVLKITVPQRLFNKPFAAHGQIQILLFLILIVFSQTISHIRYFQGQIQKFSNKSLSEKISNNFEKSYAFAQYCKRHLPGKHACRVETEIDRNPQGNLLTYLAIRYYLYPLNIVTPSAPSDVDCLIIVLKKDPLSFVPAGFQPCPLFDPKSLIAVKKDSNRCRL